MDRIDFYILPGSGSEVCERFTCRLLEKAYDQGHRAFVRCVDSAQVERLDQLLWSFRPSSFLPHARSERAGDEPIILGSEAPAKLRADLLINLADDAPSNWQDYQRLAEVVDQPRLPGARERFRRYRAAGHEPHYHKLNME